MQTAYKYLLINGPIQVGELIFQSGKKYIFASSGQANLIFFSPFFSHLSGRDFFS